jgi:hypothetical protein
VTCCLSVPDAIVTLCVFFVLFSVDVWDGPETPIVYHGNTLTTKIAFSDVVSVIAQFAFEASKSVSSIFQIHLSRSIFYSLDIFDGCTDV